MAPSSVLTSTPAKVLGLGALAGAACLGYAAGIEVRNFTVRRLEVPCLPVGAAPIKVLHVSDLHVTPNQASKLRWVASLAALEPDLVVNTGDNLAHLEAVGPLLDAFGPLRDVPGVFVLGSNDYFAPKLRNPLWYPMPDDGKRNTSTPQLRWKELKQELSQGWLDLTNTTGRLEVNGSTIAFAGVDDPHLEYDDLAAVAGPADPHADVRVGVTHAPYVRVLDQFAGDGYETIFAGHTHGGQVCLPFKGALVTNCDLDTDRVKGLSTHEAEGRRSYLHVSAGCGANRYTPVRFACPPEVTLLTLVGRG